MARIIDLATLAKTSVDSNDYFVISNTAGATSKKINVSSIFASLVTAGTGGEDIWSSITNKNQLNFKGIKSGDTGLLTIATTDNNIVLTALESGIDLSLCNNGTAGFLSGMDFTSQISGECPVTSGGTGLSSIVKGAMLYASATDTIAATAAMSTNGQLLIGNATNGYPSVATLTAGTGMTITNGAGTITLASTLTTMAGELNMATYNVNLNTAAGESWITGAAGLEEGMTVDVDGKVFIGEAEPTAFFDSALNVKGSLTFDAATAPTIKPKLRAGSAGVKTTLEGGSASNAIGGDLDLKAGSSTVGNFNGGNLNLYGGDEAGSGTAGSIKNFISNGSGSEIQALTITGGVAAPDVTVNAGNLAIVGASKGIVIESIGTVTQDTSHSTAVDAINSTAGVITLYNVALAAGAEADFAVPNSTIKTDSVILLTVQSPAATSATDNASLHAELDEVNNGSMNIRLTNPGAGATSGIYKIHFLVIQSGN